MDESTLRASIASLDKQLEDLKPWLYAWVASVALGCLGEIVSVIREYREDREKWYKTRSTGSIERPEKPSWKWLAFDAIAVAIVVIGIAGELVIDFRSNRIETELRQANDQLFLFLEQESGAAASSAKNAVADAAKAKTDSGTAVGQADAAKYNADEATKKSADAVADAKTLELAMKDANSQLAVLDTKRKELEDALVNLAVCTAPRVIPGGYSNGVSYAKPLESLAGFTAHIVVVSDPESRRAAWNLATALHDAGLTVTVDPSGPREGLLDGVWVNWYSLASATNEDSAHAGSPLSIANHEAVPVSREAADRIVSFLGSYNWQARSVEGSVSMHDVTPKGLRIEVGLYPPTEVVTPPAMVGIAEPLAKALENNEIARKADRRKRFEERIKDMSPAEAARETINEEKSIKMMEDADRQYKAEHARDNVQPCKPLDKQFSAALSR